MAMMTTGKQFVKVPLKPFSAVCWAHDFEREGVHSDGMWTGVVLSGDLKREEIEFEMDSTRLQGRRMPRWNKHEPNTLLCYN